VAVSSNRTTSSAPLSPRTDEKFVPATFQSGTTAGGFVGVDGGSISTTAVLLSEEGEILYKAC
jgi:activator of 2-hydroxyglutaryl-CoA dehydratase